METLGTRDCRSLLPSFEPMPTELGDAAVEAANLALKMGSAAVDVVSFMADLGEELPVLNPLLKTITAIREKVETVKSNREELHALQQRCTYVTACVIVKLRQGPSSSSGLDVTPLKDCIDAARTFTERCSQRRKLWRVLKASSDKDELATLNARVDRLAGDLSLAGIVTVLGEATDLKGILEQMVKNQAADQREVLANQANMLDHLGSLLKPPQKMADVPQGAPTPKSWHVKRPHVMEAIFEAVIGEGGPRLVGLVGDSGAGKTTAASEIVRSKEVRETFTDGIVWLAVNDGAKERLPALMMQLAYMVYEDIGGSVGRAPEESGDGAAYIKQYMERGHRGKGLRCLMVADNVWEAEVVAKLLETGMWVLVSTRGEELVTGAQGVAVGVDELSTADAKSVLRKAAELSPEVDLPDDAVDLIELCGRVAMDLAFVGRWSTVRGRQDRTAWSDAAGKVRTEIAEIENNPENDTARDVRAKRRKAILRAGFEDLAIGSDDERVQRLYLSLAVMPDGHGLTTEDAAVLLYDRSPTAEDVVSVRGVVDILERWSALSSTGQAYRMHDAHSDFSRKSLMDRGDVRRPALERWVRHISSLDALRSIQRHDLKSLWLGVERVGGGSWEESRPYEAALAEMDDSDPFFHASAKAVGKFQEAQEDWERASTTWGRLLKVGQASVAWRQLLEAGLGHSTSAPYDDGESEVVDSSLHALHHLIICAHNNNNTEEQAMWRDKWFEFIPYWMAVDTDEHLASNFSFHCNCYARAIPNHTDLEKFLRQCLVIQKARLDPGHVQIGHTLHDLGASLQRADHLEEAEKLLRRSISIKGTNLGLDNIGLAKTQREVGVCMRKTGRLDGAEDILRRALKAQEADLGSGGLEVGFTLHELGVCMRECKRLEEADEMLRRSLEIMQEYMEIDALEVLFEPKEWIADTLYELSTCAREAGRGPEEVNDLLKRSEKAKQEHKLAKMDWLTDENDVAFGFDDCCVIS